MGGSLDTDKIMRAVLQYCNTPMQDCRRSPAQIVFGRQMRDFIPSLTYKYEPAKDWAVTQEHRERTLANKREMDNQRWSHRTKALDDLEVGTAVAIQNQTGPNPTKWDKTGIVLENKPNSKVMQVDGSRRVTMRNRRFVRPMEPSLRLTTRPETARRRPAAQPTTRQGLPRSTQLNSPPVQEDNVDETPAEVHEGGSDERFEEVHDTEEVHHEVDVRQDVDTADVRDDAQDGGRDVRAQERLFEDNTEV
jgi:hypothetical protein